MLSKKDRRIIILKPPTMKKIFILCLPVILCLITNEIFAQTNTEGLQVAFITAINTKGNDIVIEADFVQMLTGKAAVTAAKKKGEAEYDINKKKDTVWYVPNDYFILNENNKLRKLPVTNSVEIYFVNEGTSAVSKSNIAKLKKTYTAKLFKLTIFKGSVIKIAEIYTP